MEVYSRSSDETEFTLQRSRNTSTDSAGLSIKSPARDNTNDEFPYIIRDSFGLMSANYRRNCDEDNFASKDSFLLQFSVDRSNYRHVGFRKLPGGRIRQRADHK